MAKSYSGVDKTENFFAHYGRKGMKRGMNIYNPDYKPVGEKAKGPQVPKAPGNANLPATDPRYAVKKGSLAATDPRYKKQTETSAKDREREAMDKAAKAATALGVKSKRERLLEAERKRQLSNGMAAHEARKVNPMYGLKGNDVKKANNEDLLKRIKENKMTNDKLDIDRDKEVLGYRQNVENNYTSYNDEEKGYYIEALNVARDALNLGKISGEKYDLSDEKLVSALFADLAISAGRSGYDSLIDYVNFKGKATKDRPTPGYDVQELLDKAEESYNKRYEEEQKRKEYEEYLKVKEYNSKKNNW